MQPYPQTQFPRERKAPLATRDIARDREGNGYVRVHGERGGGDGPTTDPGQPLAVHQRDGGRRPGVGGLHGLR